MYTIVCQPSENHPGKIHLSISGGRTLCGRGTRGTAWGNKNPLNTFLRPSEALDYEEDCKLCISLARKREEAERESWR